MVIQDVRLEDPDFYFEGRRESYQRLQAECPVYYYEPLDLFVLTKHEDIREAARRPEIFSSSRGLHLHQLRLTPSEVAAYATLYSGGEQFAFADPPRHRELRGVATRAFAPRPLDGVIVAAVSIGISLLATLYPATSAARVLPAEALRYE